MVQLKRAYSEMFRRSPDETFGSIDQLHNHCRHQREASTDHWKRPSELSITHDLTVAIGDSPDYELNDWSFTLLCRMAGVSKDTINRLSHRTASLALEETLPSSAKPLQVLTSGQQVRSVHGVAYTRLWNADVLDTVRKAAPDFTAPQEAFNGGTGLYCGEQDMVAFLIDPLGWVEIQGEAFAPGFFVWNSEVGRRPLGIQTFWFQAVCRNHIVWDAVEVVEFTRKHTANVRDGLEEVGRIAKRLVASRDQRRDSFTRVLRKAVNERLGENSESVLKILGQEGIPCELAKQAIEIAGDNGRFTIFAIVDALTRLSQQEVYVGDRTELDVKIGQLLALAM